MFEALWTTYIFGLSLHLKNLELWVMLVADICGKKLAD